MLKTSELCNYLNKILLNPPIKDYCPNGLQVEGKSGIKRLATAVTASLATIQTAVEWKADALLVHHGLFWGGDPLVLQGSLKKRLSPLFSHDINLFAYHLPLDAHQEFGNNWKAARDLGWESLEGFCEYNGAFIGVKGSFDSMPRDAFCEKIEKYYQHKAHCALGGKEMVASAALISGGAYKSIPDAAREEVDCFITGNFDEGAWHMAHEEEINFFAMGHSATEVVGVQALGAHLEEKYGITHEFLDIPNPF